MKVLKDHMKNNGEEYYSKILATKIVDKLEVFTTKSVSREELTTIVTGVIKEHLSIK
jgi:hypothetical protein